MNWLRPVQEYSFQDFEIVIRSFEDCIAQADENIILKLEISGVSLSLRT